MRSIYSAIAEGVFKNVDFYMVFVVYWLTHQTVNLEKRGRNPPNTHLLPNSITAYYCRL